MPPFSIHDWFCLKTNRDGFKPHNQRDRDVILCHEHQVSDEIIGSIERRFASNEPIKMLLYGDWGVGKTHTINHVCWWLEVNAASYPAKPVVIEIGDIDKKTRFDALLSRFVDVLTPDFIVGLVHDYLGRGNPVAQSLTSAGVAPHVSEAFAKLLMAP